MNWKQLLLCRRFGLEEYEDTTKRNRTEFQRDYDRLIFSSPFRRLQNKTQVFPLPNKIFVHNRLTHSIEVSSVGRSLGDIISRILREKYPKDEADFDSIGTIVAAGCLAHDLGNPPFGHSGENAISDYFGQNNEFDLKNMVKEQNGRWSDFENFDGNANSLRLLIHQFQGRRKGGLALTYPVIASIVKYPYSSSNVKVKNKLGFFQSEENDYLKIASALGIKQIQNNNNKDNIEFARHPLVLLVEAADDICYKIMDIEDAFKLKILAFDETVNLLLAFFEEEKIERTLKIMEKVDDNNEQISYLRASVIGILINKCVEVFINNEKDILAGNFQGNLIKHISKRQSVAYKKATEVSINKIYKAKEVIDVELAGHKILEFLLHSFINAVFTPEKHYSKLLLNRVPSQYDIYSEDNYTKILSVVDFISSMTDIYALDLFRKIKGTSL